MTALTAITSLFATRAAASRHIPGGQPLYQTGDAADALFLVVAGAFAVFRTIDGNRAMLGIVRPGEIVGESAVLAATSRTATVVALRDSEVTVIPAETFFKSARRSPEAMTEIAQLLIQRARSAGGTPLRASKDDRLGRTKSVN